MPIATTISQTSDNRLVLTHYAPGEECRAHRHAGTQTSLVLAGSYHEESKSGSLIVEGKSLSWKPADFEHQNRFGDTGALILSINGLAGAANVPDYRVSACDSDAGGLNLLVRAASGQHLPGRAPSERSDPGVPNASGSSRMQTARDHLLAEPNIAIAAVARTMGMHPIHFARLFRKAFGRPPAKARRDHRAAQAIHRIVRTTASLADIAAAEGFADQAHMTRIISGASGWTPGALRRLFC